MLAEETINTGVQLAVVLFIAAVLYLLAGRNRGGFGKFTGLTLPTGKSMMWALLAALVFVPLTLALFYFTPLREAASAGNTVAGKLGAEGFSGETIAVIALVAMVKTSLTEEILFRGLIAKRLIRWWGLLIGNTLHAALFGAIHMIIFIAPGGPEFNWVIATAFFVITGGGGWVMAYLNERIGNGSIAPSWLLHGLGNLSAFPLLAFG